ncbi:MAG: helix-turn-helix transcriptional regulator [Alphaproteobacteria bacterium]|nr:helix-turn-helix transcriptional regulator [Alphaproteobacteria bacterium]
MVSKTSNERGSTVLSPEQIRAARALLDWTLTDLSDRVGIAGTNLGKIERRESSPSARTIQKLMTVFAAAGIEFLPDDGVKRSNATVTVMDAPHEEFYLQVLTNALQTLDPGKDLLIFNADGALSTPEVIAVQQKILAKGIDLRFLIKAKSVKRHPNDEIYRTLPPTDALTLQLVYGSTVFTRMSEGGRTVIIRDQTFADAQRELFMMIWNNVQ